MQIVHYIPTRFPIQGYGGTERIAYWLGKAQAEMGHSVIYLCKKDSDIPFARTINAPDNFDNLTPFIPSKTDIVQLYNVFPISKNDKIQLTQTDQLNIKIPKFKLDYPFLVGIHGNAKPLEIFHPNTVFVSRNHAARHNWTEYVYNGVDISEYPFTERKEDFLLFLAKASWRVKNLPGAIQIANKAKITLQIGGGKAPFWSRGVLAHGTVAGNKKIELLQKAQALLFPIIWDEPFGLITVEALACGTPVIATPRGSLPEIVDSSCGILADSFDELVEATTKIKQISSEACRERVKQKFTHIHMAEKYLFYYSKILENGYLREGYPIAKGKNQRVIQYRQPSKNLIINFLTAAYMKSL